MKLLRNNCHVRANVAAILVAANAILYVAIVRRSEELLALFHGILLFDYMYWWGCWPLVC